MRRVLVSVTVAITLAFAETSAQAHSPTRQHACATKGHVIVADRQAEIYEAEEPTVGAGLFVTACVFGTGHISRLGGPTECGSGICGGVERETLNRTIVAYESYFSRQEVGRWYVAVRDLRSGRILRHLPTGTPLATKPNSPGVGPTTGLAVTTDGSVAWIAWDIQRSREGTPSTPEARYYDVYAADRFGMRLLAAGFDVNPSSLALAGSTAYWMQGGKPASVRLR